jgi:hypothetical protein
MTDAEIQRAKVIGEIALGVLRQGLESDHRAEIHGRAVEPSGLGAASIPGSVAG